MVRLFNARVLSYAAVALVVSAFAPRLSAQAPQIESVEWSHAGQYVVRGTCPANGTVEIRKHPGGQLVGQGVAQNGRFTIYGNPNVAGAGSEILPHSPAQGDGARVKVPAMSSRRLEVGDGLSSGPPRLGCYFDVRAKAPGVALLVESIDVVLAPGTWVIGVSTVLSGASHEGLESSPSAWDFLGAATVTSNGPDRPTPIPVPILRVVASDSSRGFRVEAFAGNIPYLEVRPPNSPVAEDPYALVESGPLILAPWVADVTTSCFQGAVHYATTPLNLPAAIHATWQENQALLHVDIDGLETNGFAPAVTSSSGPIVTTNPPVLFLDVAGTALSDLGVVAGALLPWQLGSGFATSGGQIINLDLTAPTLAFLNSGSSIPALSAWSGITALPLPMNLPVTLSAQGVALDPASPEGLVLTQGIQYSP